MGATRQVQRAIVPGMTPVLLGARHAHETLAHPQMNRTRVLRGDTLAFTRDSSPYATGGHTGTSLWGACFHGFESSIMCQRQENVRTYCPVSAEFWGHPQE